MAEKSSRVGSRTPEDRARFLRGITGPEHDILTVEGVAKMLHCTMDAVRRIPNDQLPAHKGPGQHLLYLHSEVIDYVERLPRDAQTKRPAQRTEKTPEWIAAQRRAVREALQ